MAVTKKVEYADEYDKGDADDDGGDDNAQAPWKRSAFRLVRGVLAQML